jgi:hypothetical protein
MRASTVLTFVVLFAIAMIGPGFVILHLPLVPNWPYVGLVSMGVAVLMGGGYALLYRRELSRHTPISKAWLFRVFPVWFAAFSLFWCLVRHLTEKFPSMEFSQGRVIEKYRSSNHGALSARVEVKDRGTLACEGLPPATWNALSPGSRVAKTFGSSDFTILTP